MQYKLIQYRDKDLKKFNDEVNKYLKDNWELHGDYRVIVVEGTDITNPGYIINSQLLQKEEDKPALGFNVKK
jgi:hypothetical protein